MALFRVDFYSHYLERNVVLTVVLPADKMDGNKLALRRAAFFFAMSLP